jgi:hypothetical protein
VKNTYLIYGDKFFLRHIWRKEIGIKLNKNPYMCPMNPLYICPFNIPTDEPEYDDFFDEYDYEDLYAWDEDDRDYYEGMRQRPEDVARIMSLINRRFGNHYTELERYGVRRAETRNVFTNTVSYVLRNANNYSGTIEQRTNAILNDLRRDNPAAFNLLRRHGVPNARINQIISDIIRFTLENIDIAPETGWSQWEDLGGILTSAPAVASWQPNRLDVFARGQNNHLWHRYWNGARWSEWEDLGGVLTTGPAAVSWGPNRIDVFARGQNQALWHIYWDGIRWSAWEDLGGVLTSEPAVASWGANRLDVFGRGQNQALWHKYWDGTRWSEWEDLGGSLTSAPAAVSWGPNRIDVFGRGQNQSLWHKYWDGSRWSAWEDLGGGQITSAPAAASTGTNRLEVFARNQRNELVFRTWNGTQWGGWRTLGGVLTSDPAAISWGGNRLDVFARGQNNHLWHIWRV